MSTTIIPGVGLGITGGDSSVDSSMAEITTIVPEAIPQTGESELNSRLTPDLVADGILTGRQRFVDEDETNLITRQAIQIEAVNLTRVQQATNAQEESQFQSPSSSREAVAQATNRTYVSQKRINDNVRSLQRLQRTCNHVYDKVSRRCLYCTKHRDSHVCDAT